MLVKPLLTTLLAFASCCFFSHCNKQKETAIQQENIRELVQDEEAVLEVTKLTQRIASALNSGSVISPETLPYFSSEISIVDLLDTPPTEHTASPELGISKLKWELAPTTPQSPSLDSPLWSALSTHTPTISDASFGYISGKSSPDGTLKTVLKFSAKGITDSQAHLSYKGKLEVDWQRSGDDWKITRWHTKSMTATSRDTLLFSDQVKNLLLPSGVELAQRSFHEEKLTEFIETGETILPKGQYGAYFKLESDYQHPAVSVVDINQDGWDDIFVTSLWAPCQLWINMEGQGFRERASQYGIDAPACNTSAIFADFDNDGDPDLLLGRSLERTLLFWNNGGWFSKAADELPFLVTSASAADCNNDGLLDLYLCTYGPSGTAAKYNPKWMSDFLDKDVAAKLRSILPSSHRYYDQAGPKNYLMINRGDQKFEFAPANDILDQYHNTYQGSWGDYDKDGDVDLYICNDFAPDSLLRNDGVNENGIPKFTDVSKQLSSDTMKGFGMGASWGDFNNDQQPDLFVTNMYSKAGHRILSRFDNVDDRLHFSARGNLLFQQKEGKFLQLAGEDKNFGVDQGGWAFGGQFVDINNDGWQDIYAPNGFYTAPKKVASEADL